MSWSVNELARKRKKEKISLEVACRIETPRGGRGGEGYHRYTRHETSGMSPVGRQAQGVIPGMMPVLVHTTHSYRLAHRLHRPLQALLKGLDRLPILFP